MQLLGRHHLFNMLALAATDHLQNTAGIRNLTLTGLHRLVRDVPELKAVLQPGKRIAVVEFSRPPIMCAPLTNTGRLQG